MKRKNCSSIVFQVLILFLFFSSTKAQVQFYGKVDINEIKQGKTYVVMNNLESEEAEPYIEVFKKYWNLTPIEFIKETDIGTYAKEGSYFLICQQSISYSDNRTIVRYHFKLWTVSPRYFKSKKTKFHPEYAQTIAYFALSASVHDINLESSFMGIIDIYKDFADNPKFRDWCPGIVKNYIQHLTSLLEKGKARSLNTRVVVPEELGKLNTKTLYILDGVLKKHTLLGPEPGTELSVDEIMSNYTLPYKYISIAELNKNILADDEPFYYFMSIRVSTFMYIYVVNSKTGELIYSRPSFGINVSANDFSNIQKEIIKAKN